ncbi:MAG: hypothetical protein R6X02_24350 [Enhygromyxa sp.]
MFAGSGSPGRASPPAQTGEMLSAICFTLTLGSPPIIEPPNPADTFDPVHGEVTVDDSGMEILVYDDNRKLVGAMVMAPTPSHVQIDASFVDGYVSVGLLLLGPDEIAAPFRLEPNLLTDLSPDEAAARIETMLSFVDPMLTDIDIPGGSRQAGPSRRQCMWIFAGAALMCGVSAVTPGNIAAAAGCLIMVHNGICACSDYIPIKVC